VEDEVGRYFESPLAVRIVANNHDIMKYVAYQIAEDHNPVDMNDDLRTKSLQKLPTRRRECTSEKIPP